MSAASDDSIENIDFGGRFARQFFNNTLSNLEGTNLDASQIHTQLTNPTTSTPVASDNSICDSAYESFAQAHRKSSTSPNAQSISGANTSNSFFSHHHHNQSSQLSKGQHNQNQSLQPQLQQQQQQHHLDHHHASLDLNNNNINNANNNNDNSSNSNNTANQKSQSLAPNDNKSISSTSPSVTADELAKLSARFGLMKLIMTPDVSNRQQRSSSLFTTTPSVATSFVTSTPNPWSVHDVYQRFGTMDNIERAVSLHRTAASYSEPQYTWSGTLPSRSYKNPVFSCKVFLGGVPWDVTEQGLIETFGRFGPLRVQWPGKDARHLSDQTKAGYVYLIYESERFVKALLQACTQDFGAGSHPEKYYYQLSSRRMRFKEVQVIPWVLADSNYIRNQPGRPDLNRTVFVGALHGMLTAEGLAKIMNDLFNGVVYVGIDSDKHKYPIGSGRVTFNNQRSYMKAVSAAFIEVKSPQFRKKIQVDPYVEPSQCSTCHIQNGHIFCRTCLRYFCKTCWSWHLSAENLSGNQEHRPLMRKKREN